MICITLNDLYYVEWFVLRWMICIRWMICTTLSDLSYTENFELRWMICTALNYLHSAELFVVERWMICTTLNDFLLRCKICATWNDLYIVERFIQRWMIRSAMNDLYNVESFGLFCTNLFADFFLICKYQEEICSALPQKLVIKRCFDHSSGNYY